MKCRCSRSIKIQCWCHPQYIAKLLLHIYLELSFLQHYKWSTSVVCNFSQKDCCKYRCSHPCRSH